MQTVDEQPETIHVYVVRDEVPKPQLYPIFLSLLALFVLVALSVAIPYQQPVTRAVIRVPAVLLPPKTFTTTAVIIPTGVRTYAATTAHGTLTFSNGSIIGQYVPAGFTIGGVVTNTAVYVPPGNANGYGWAQVQAHAVMVGKSGNLPAYAINSVIGTSVFIRNLTAFHGGQDSYFIKFVTDKDRSTAITSARNALLSMSSGLHYPCLEARSVNTSAVRVSWRCQFVTYNLPAYMHISSVRIIGKNLLITVTFTPHVMHVGMK